MKLRAPRCREAMLPTSLPAGSISAPPAAAKTCEPGTSSESAISVTNNLDIVDHPLRYRLGLVDGGVVRHQQEKREVDDRENSREDDVHAFSRLQTEPPKGKETDHEQSQGRTVNPATIANRAHPGTIEPRQEQRQEYRRAHQYRAPQLVRHRTQDRVERSEVPDRRNVLRGHHGVRRFKICVLEEIPAHVRREEHH